MNKSDLTVLGFLQIKPMYGYEIMQFIKEKGLNVWAGVKMPSIYKALQRLEKKGRIVGEQVTEGNNPPRTVFSISEDGKVHYKNVLLYFLTQKDQVSTDFWLALSLMGGLSKEQFSKIINDRIDYLEVHTDDHCKSQEILEKEKQKHFIPYYIDILIKMGAHMHELEIKSLKEIREGIDKPENSLLFVKEED